MLCLVRSLLVGAMSQHAICDVDFVLLRMIFFVLTCEAGRCRTWVFGQYLPFVFAFFLHAVVASMC